VSRAFSVSRLLPRVAIGLSLLAASLFGPEALSQDTDQQLNLRLLEFSKQQDEARVRRLVEEGAAVNSRNRLGETPLILWVKAGNAGMVAWLIQKGANVNQEALNRTTPLMVAAFAGRTDLMQMWAGQGAPLARALPAAELVATLAREAGLRA